ncbi:hypothetical protein [Zooshikella ganghwensis]|uniref:hypothetical protein n=1 Tax=Zooshikella ganghwensis TaxID=202772 RepID=UPI000419E487|nr:hypothetical protein [Zooshikella ganghwensis]
MPINYHQISSSNGNPYIETVKTYLRLFEHFRTTPYNDSEGLLTIGDGFMIEGRSQNNILGYVLEEIGVFAASNTQENERRTLLGLPAETARK